MTTTVSPQDQLAASRMLCARLHVALSQARGHIAARDDFPLMVAELDSALEHSEPEIHALRTDAERAHREAQRLGEARTHSARMQGALLDILIATDPTKPGDDETRARMWQAGMAAITCSDMPIAQLAADIKALATRHDQEGDDLAEPARRVLGAFQPIEEEG